LFESVRELLVNIQKHAKTGNVRVDVSRKDGIIVIIVEDDGMGFDADERLSLISKVILKAPLKKGEVYEESRVYGN